MDYSEQESRYGNGQGLEAGPRGSQELKVSSEEPLHLADWLSFGQGPTGTPLLVPKPC